MLKIENCPTATACYSAERMVLNQNRSTAVLLNEPTGHLETNSRDSEFRRIGREQRTHLLLFASYIPLLLVVNTSGEDNSGILVLLVCCVFAFFLFGGRRSNKIED